MRRNLILIAGAVLVASCHSTPPAKTPQPSPSAAEIARQKQVQDSLAAVAARADSVARAEQLALKQKQQSDSIEAARLAAERLTREAAEQANGTLRDELATNLYFDAARSTISAEGKTALDRKAAILEANPDVKLQITGACDERGSERYNMALGEQRAGAAKRYLIGKGIEAGRLEQISTGEGSPANDGHDEAAWAQNRRTSFMITSGNSLLATE